FTVDPSFRPPGPSADLPTQFDLPCEDGAKENYFDLPQSALLTASGWPMFNQVFGADKFCASHDMAVYWDLTPDRVARANVPDWCLVPNVSPMPKGLVRRSFVVWEEEIKPLIALEYVSG